jgi:hypothetical protein
VIEDIKVHFLGVLNQTSIYLNSAETVKNKIPPNDFEVAVVLAIEDFFDSPRFNH